ncbi:hypothetical protein JJB09_03055 [Rhizobium sp. KVB221]|uniref:Chromosomal replication initiator DnaA C-terminal domain-containing protein n=1 Tax=Rhizobium setariae TaxID=2801340 RepID=A0A936YLM3_9HYPH|nr:helix-turn-helix domain-containing protein [Rhizobium setariae]MBL0370997.1 hypothetical protein [Rhizobium setariae]
MSAVPPSDVLKIERRATMPGRRRALAVRSVCRTVGSIVNEMVQLIGEPDASARDKRFALTHVQQISMYVCHVVLQLTMTEIANAFGKDRTTVGHSCARVEDRRDNRGYDRLIGTVERIVGGLYCPVAHRS